MSTFVEIISLAASILCVILSALSLVMALRIRQKEKLYAAIKANESAALGENSTSVERALALTLSPTDTSSDYQRNMDLILEMQHDSSYLDSLIEQLACCDEADNLKKIEEHLMCYLVIQNSMYKNMMLRDQSSFESKAGEKPSHDSRAKNKLYKTQSAKVLWTMASKSVPGILVYKYKPERLGRLAGWTVKRQSIDALPAKNKSIEEYLSAVLEHSKYTEEQEKQVKDRLVKISTALAHQEKA